MVVLDTGFNRGRDNKSNTFEAILEARKRASNNIYAIELGNEPDRKTTQLRNVIHCLQYKPCRGLT